MSTLAQQQEGRLGMDRMFGCIITMADTAGTEAEAALEERDMAAQTSSKESPCLIECRQKSSAHVCREILG